MMFFQILFSYNIKGENFHLAGHSLGSHVMVWDVNVSTKFNNRILQGTAGRTFTSKQKDSELVGRISGEECGDKDGNRYRQVSSSTGLDPAGPRFVDGPYVDKIPELAENILRKVLHSLIKISDFF